ncbi:MAG: DUF3352 domain-containing protein [Anaerolineae bacterium]|nr:DUF3352 domain-containing protein [Anaerolineae bacterium]
MQHSRRLWLILGATIVGLIVLAIGAVWLLPRLLGVDEDAIIQHMPADTAVFAEINLLNLQDSASRQTAVAFEDAYDSAEIPFNAADPTTIFNGLDNALMSLTGVTVSEDVRPWMGTNAGAGFLAPGEDGQPRWLLAATVRDEAGATAFVEKVNGIGQGTAVRHDNLVLLASDPATLAAAQAAPDGLNLADSRRYQETLAQLPDKRAATVYVNMAEADTLLATAVPIDQAGVVQAIRGLLPIYTAIGLAAFATDEGIQVEMVGLHEPLNETQQAWLAAQTAVPTTDTWLPTHTALYLTGQRLDLLWLLLKDSLDGLGYSAADVDEATQLFTGLFGFNPDTDLLAALDGPFALALIPVEGETAVPGLSGVLLAEHNQPENLAGQAASLATGLSRLGFTAVNNDGIYEVSNADGSPLVVYTVDGNNVVVGTEMAGITAVTTTTEPLAAAPHYQGVWAKLPATARPLLFANTSQLAGLFALDPQTLPITQAVMGTTSDNNISRATLMLIIGED